MGIRGKHFYGRARTIEVGIAAVPAGSSTELPIWNAPFRCKVIRVGVVPATAVTGADTNYMTLSVVNKGSDGTGTAAIASKDYTAGKNIAQFDYDSLGPVSNNLLRKNDTLTFKKAETGTGMGMPDLVVVVEYVRR